MHPKDSVGTYGKENKLLEEKSELIEWKLSQISNRWDQWPIYLWKQEQTAEFNPVGYQWPERW